MSDVILQVRNLSVDFATDDGVVHAVKDVSYEVRRGKTLAIVGESGSGKTVSSLAIMGLLGTATATMSGSAVFGGTELVNADAESVRALSYLSCLPVSSPAAWWCSVTRHRVHETVAA